MDNMDNIVKELRAWLNGKRRDRAFIIILAERESASDEHGYCDYTILHDSAGKRVNIYAGLLMFLKENPEYLQMIHSIDINGWIKKIK